MALGVAAICGGDLQVVVIVDVAVRAGVHLACRGQLMRVSERETCGAVIKIGRLPGNRVVAGGAGGNREYCGRCGMLGVGGLLPGREMAT